MKKIAIIGASYLQLPLVQKCKEMGLEVHCFAWEEGAVCSAISDYFYPISVVDKEQIFEVCKSIAINGIISIASDVAVPTISYVAEKLGLISNSQDSSFAQTNKYEMRKKFIRNKISCPHFALAEGNYLLNNQKFPLIVKPTDRSGSRGIMKVNSLMELNFAVERAKEESFLRQAIIEEYVSGLEVSVETISWQGKHYILAITDKVTTGEPYFVELEHHQPSVLSDDIQDAIWKETCSALDSLDIKYGASHTEFKISPEGKTYLIEVGARMGGDFIGSDLTSLSTGYDFLKGLIEISLGIFEEPLTTKSNCSGVYFLCKETEFLLPIVQDHKNNDEIVRAEITDSKLNAVKSSADRSGYFVYQSHKRFIV